MINAGVVASYQDSKAMTARVEQDRKLTQTLFGHGLRRPRGLTCSHAD